MAESKFSASSRHRDLNRSATNIPSAGRIANIALMDAMILPYDANPAGWNFRKGQDSDAYEAARKQYDLQPSDRLAGRLREEFYKSWERIIDMDVLTEPHWHAMEKKSIKACFWRLEMNQVRSFKPFTSANDRHG